MLATLSPAPGNKCTGELLKKLAAKNCDAATWVFQIRKTRFGTVRAAAIRIIADRDDLDLLFTDIVMSGDMNGRQLAEAALAIRPHLKVLFNLGFTEGALVHHDKLDHSVHLLTKPYGRIELARKLRIVLAEVTEALVPVARRPGRLLILDDDQMVCEVLSTAARRLGFEVELTSRAQDFFDRLI